LNLRSRALSVLLGLFWHLAFDMISSLNLLTSDDLNINLNLVLSLPVVSELPVILVNGNCIVSVYLSRDVPPCVLKGIAVELREWILSEGKLVLLNIWELKTAQLIWLLVKRDLLQVDLWIEVRGQRFNGDLGLEVSLEWVGIFVISIFDGSWNLQDVPLNVLGNGLVLELNEKDIVIEATMLKIISGVVIVWHKFNASLLLEIKVKKSIIIFTRLKVNVVIGSSMEVSIGGFDRQRSKISLSGCMPKVIVWPNKIRVKTNVHFNLTGGNCCLNDEIIFTIKNEFSYCT
jgi:hypothetical protein